MCNASRSAQAPARETSLPTIPSVAIAPDRAPGTSPPPSGDGWLIDTPDNPAADLLLLARELCRAPIALLLVQDPARLWIGQTTGWRAIGSALEASACAACNAAAGPLLLARLSTGDSPHLLAAARLPAPDDAPDDAPDGAPDAATAWLAILDHAARPPGLSAAEESGLRALARQAALLLDLQRRLAAANRRAEALAASEARQHQALQASGIGLWEIDPVTLTLHGDDRVQAMLGLPPGAAATLPQIRAVVHTLDLPQVETAIAALQRTPATSQSAEFRVIGPPGALPRWIRAAASLRRDGDGLPRIAGTATDVTEAHAAARDKAMIALGDRLRRLDTTEAIAAAAAETIGRTLSASHAAYLLVDAAGQTLRCERGWSADGEPVSTDAQPLAAPPARDALARGEALSDAAGPGARHRLHVPLIERDRLAGVFELGTAGPRDWTEEEVGFIRSVADRTQAAITRVQTERRQRLLNQELSHRMKNILAMAQAIATQTLRTAPDLATAREVITGRMVALGRAHDILLDGGVGSASVAQVIERTLEVHDDRQARFRLDGPALTIGAQPGLSLALMINELATNAVKYGALSTPHGEVAVRWSIEPGEADTPDVILEWIERGGPPVTPPQHRGFGTRLIAAGLPGGRTTLTFAASGAQCRVVVPLAALR